MFKQCTVINKQTGEMLNSQVDTELEGLVDYPYHEATQEEIQAKKAEQVQNKTNAEAKEFLSASDWKVIRHRDQLAMGIPTSLTVTEYENFLEQRQIYRNKIV